MAAPRDSPPALRATPNGRGSFPERLRNYARLTQSLSDSEAIAAADFQQFEQVAVVVDRNLGIPLRSTRILEVGCGQRCGVTLLLGAAGAQVIGIDTAFVGPLFSILSPTVWRQSGLERTVRTVVRRALFDRAYYRRLEVLFGAKLDLRGVDVRLMNACQMQFQDESFDFVYSCAAFEHINDVPAAAAEISRVLRRGGVGFVSIHLYPSISGGHSLEWRDPHVIRKRDTPPWDHLRANRFPSGVNVNGLREADYLKAFGTQLTILDVRAKYEGERFLTPEIERECQMYSREELLRANLSVVFRKDR